VAEGDGMKRLYRQLGANVVEGGSSLNPSTFELLAGIHGVPAEEVIVLPNSPNVIMAADRAAELSEKTVAVVESRSPQAGPGRLVEPNAEASAGTDALRLLAEIGEFGSGELAVAALAAQQQRQRRL